MSTTTLEAFEPQTPTWDLILKHCPESEVEEVKRILGPSLVEQAIDLQEEVSCWVGKNWHI